MLFNLCNMFILERKICILLLRAHKLDCPRSVRHRYLSFWCYRTGILHIIFHIFSCILFDTKEYKKLSYYCSSTCLRHIRCNFIDKFSRSPSAHQILRPECIIFSRKWKLVVCITTYIKELNFILCLKCDFHNLKIFLV